MHRRAADAADREEATLMLWAPDYDGGNKAWVRFRRRQRRDRRRLAGQARGLTEDPRALSSRGSWPPRDGRERGERCGERCRSGSWSQGLVVAVALIAPTTAGATITDVFGGRRRLRHAARRRALLRLGADPARSTVPAWDGVPIDVDVAFPPEPASGPDGNYPLMMMFHGYGGDKIGLGGMQHWLDRGYATFSMTDRGFHESCGSQASKDAAPAALRQRLHPADRQPLRGSRRAGVRRPARRRRA